MIYKQCVFLLLITIVAQIKETNGQFQMEQSSSKCGNSKCVIISSCPAVLKLVFQVKSGDEEAKNKLISKQCGFERNLPKVCCHPETITTTTTSTTTTTTTTPSTTFTTTSTSTTTTSTTTSTKTTSTNTTSTTTATTTTTTIPSTAKSRFSKLNAKNCGIRTNLKFRITFGKTASTGEFPWVASLIYKNQRGRAIPLCGGALVSNEHVVTAAHCDVSQGSFSLKSVILGQIDISTPVTLPGVEIDIERVVQHPGFSTNPVAVKDIAIIKLAKKVTFTDMIRPICLYSPNTEEIEDPVNDLIVAGWGRTERARSSSVLQYTDLTHVQRKQCQSDYTQAEKKGRLGPIKNFQILPSQLCAQGSNSTDSCSGDSGGPLMSQVGTTWYLAGVVSFGTQQCDSSLPGVYTRVSNFRRWMLQTLDSIDSLGPS